VVRVRERRRGPRETSRRSKRMLTLLPKCAVERASSTVGPRRLHFGP
jgi:hypothetical protein